MAHEQGLVEIEDDGVDVVVHGDDNGATFEESEHLGHINIDLEADVSKLSGDSLYIGNVIYVYQYTYITLPTAFCIDLEKCVQSDR